MLWIEHRKSFTKNAYPLEQGDGHESWDTLPARVRALVLEHAAQGPGKLASSANPDPLSRHRPERARLPRTGPPAPRLT